VFPSVKDICPIKKPVSVIPSGSCPELVEQGLKGNWLTEVHLEQWSLNGTNVSKHLPFLANVNSRSLYAIDSPSVVCL